MQHPSSQQRLTPAQLWFVHMLELLAIGAVFVAVQTLYQAIQHGTLDYAQLATTVAGAVVAFLSKGFAATMSNAQAGQAGQDTLNEVKASVNALATSHQSLLSMLSTAITLFLQGQQSNTSSSPSPVATPSPAAPGQAYSETPAVAQITAPPQAVPALVTGTTNLVSLTPPAAQQISYRVSQTTVPPQQQQPLLPPRTFPTASTPTVSPPTK